ncbi:retron Ec48 family effector membrane protein [Pseudomonas corrugata]|uniref:retron Ec48 family effector membrane protein n=1 Tax=Pseudomonas corrugata TaxID=47879 RepID=UPI0028C47E13|nr:retron Ec48 family effector membrane protein [Pseudomonas corrugata]MDU9033959.1 retron Ec48 family effector membrane protein [Pseudomonas corrugata]
MQLTNPYEIVVLRCKSVREFYSRQHSYFKFLIVLLVSVGGVGFGICLMIFVAIFFSEKLYLVPSCFSNKCFINLYERYSSVFNVAKSTLDLLILVATVGAIFVALLSYLSALKSSWFTNHISHLSLFQAFFAEEVRKRDLLSISSFDPHKIYGLIYSKSRSGDMTLSESYFEFIARLNNVISGSNFNSYKASKGPFVYKDHQAEMIKVLGEIGFDLQFMPKKDFYEIETQILSLLDSISKSFCGSDRRTELEKRIYR